MKTKENSLALTSREQKQIYDSLIKNHKGNEQKINIYFLFLYTGIRASEYEELVKYLRLGHDLCEINTKGNVKRIIHIPWKILPYKIEWPNLTRFTIRNWIKEIGKIAKLDRELTTHDLRATCITNLDNLGVGVLAIQQFTGHQSLDMILKYIRRNPLRVKDISNLLVNSDLHKEQTNLYGAENLSLLKLENERLKARIKELENGKI